MYLINKYISLYIFQAFCTTSIYSPTKRRVFHNVTFFWFEKYSRFDINDVLILNVQLQDQRVNLL